MNTEDMKWCVIAESVNRKEFYEMNVFDHYSFREEVQKLLKKKVTREEFSEDLRHIAMYYFWSKSEWEIVVTSLFRGGREDSPEKKIDVYNQLRMNWERFVDYVWQFASN